MCTYAHVRVCVSLCHCTLPEDVKNFTGRNEVGVWVCQIEMKVPLVRLLFSYCRERTTKVAWEVGGQRPFKCY